MPLNVCYYWKKTGHCRRKDRCPFADTHTKNEVHFVGDDRRRHEHHIQRDQYAEVGDDRRRYEHHVQRDQYAEDGVETFVEEHKEVDEADEVNVFSVHCSAEATAKYIAKAEDDEDSDDDDCPSAISSSDEEGDDDDDEKVPESNSMPSGATTGQPFAVV